MSLNKHLTGDDCSANTLIRMLLDEIEAFDDLGSPSDQAEFLERRIAEIRSALESEDQP